MSRPGDTPGDGWTVLDAPVDAPPASPAPDPDPADGPDAPTPSWAEARGVLGGLADPPPPPAGPPGGRIFSLDDRPVPALYLLAWLLTGIGAAMLLFSTQAPPSPGRTLVLLVALLLLGSGLAAGSGYQVVARRSRPDPWYRGPAPVLVFGLVVVLSALGSGLLGAVGLAPETAAGFLVGLLVVAGGYLLGVIAFVVRTGVFTWTEMGWPAAGPGRTRRALSALVTGAAVTLVAAPVVLVLAGIVGQAIGSEAPQILPQARGVTDRILIALAVAVVAPVGEEIFFRGFALAAWARDLPVRSALVRSALFFAVVHIANITTVSFADGAKQALLQLAVIVPLGLILGWLFLRRGILAAIGGHVAWNALILGLTLVRPGSPLA